MARRGSGIRLAALKAAQEALRDEQEAQQQQLRIKTEAVAVVLDARAQVARVRARGEAAIERLREEAERDAAPFEEQARAGLRVLRGMAATNGEVAALCGLTAKEVRDALSTPRTSSTDVRMTAKSEPGGGEVIKPVTLPA
jgi:regulator of protease activity HflC (stomatin/prohibitin superfamily)